MSRRSLINCFAIVLSLAFLTTAGNCGGTLEGEAEPDRAAKSKTITIFDYKFKPQEFEARKGSQVTWVNKDRADHSVTADNGDFDVILAPGEKFSFTFEKAGTFRYIDRLNSQPGLIGKVIVR